MTDMGATRRILTWRGRNGLAEVMVPLCAALCLGADCDVETLFSDNFETDIVGSSPSPNPGTGHVRLEKGDGTVTVVSSPAPASNAGKWTRITHNHVNTTETSMVLDLTRPAGAGTSTLLATMFIPDPGPRPPAFPNFPRALATVQFEQTFFDGQAGAFLHLDFMDTRNVRIDDNPGTTFGSFPFGQPFFLLVSNEVGGGAATAHITLTSPGSGQVDHPIAFPSLAPGFNAVRFWIGAQFISSFSVDDITVFDKLPN
jgi:hypothetical protein